MAVLERQYGKTEPEFVGCVLSTYERNGYDDSDFYAVCWDEESQSVVDIEYDTTRAGSGGWAVIDATEEVLRKAYRYYKNCGRALYDTKTNPGQAKQVRKGDTVKVIKGRKVPKGSEGKVFWTGTRRNYYTYRDEERVGVEIGDERVFLPIEYVEVVDWQSRLVRGKDRKKAIRNFAINSMPFWARHYFAS